MDKTRRALYNSRLKRCPFCGGKGSIDNQRGYYMGKSTKVILVYCTCCHCRTEKFEKDPEIPSRPYENAIEAWNRRPDELQLNMEKQPV